MQSASHILYRELRHLKYATKHSRTTAHENIKQEVIISAKLDTLESGTYLEIRLS